MDRYVAIIADGSTDRQVIAKLISCTLCVPESRSFTRTVFLPRQTIRNQVDNLWSTISQSNDYSLASYDALAFVNSVAAVLWGAIDEFEKEVRKDNLNGQDLLILNTDAERVLNGPELYFQTGWAAILPKLLSIAVERFYDTKAKRGFLRSGLPLILPVTFFPSTDIVVAAARFGPASTFNHHGKRAREIKCDLYGTADLRTLRHGEFKVSALDFINTSSIDHVYRYVPESRLFLQTLCWNQAP